MPEMSVTDETGCRKKNFGNVPISTPCLPFGKFPCTNAYGKRICIGFGRLGRTDMHLHDGVERERHDGIVLFALLAHTPCNSKSGCCGEQYPNETFVHDRAV